MNPNQVINMGAMYFAAHGHIGSDDIGIIVFLAIMLVVSIGTLIVSEITGE